MTFGEKLKELRLKLNYSQSELAEVTGISERSLYTYEQLGAIPRRGNIKKLAEALKVDPSYLTDDDAKEVFMQSLMQIYMESKEEASEKFSPKKK